MLVWGDGGRGSFGPSQSAIHNVNAVARIAVLGGRSLVAPDASRQDVRVLLPAEEVTYSRGRGQDLRGAGARIARLLSEGVDVTLEASQDVIVASAIAVSAGPGRGTLRLRAGRNVVLQAPIDTGGGDLELLANVGLGAGVIDSDRGAGAGSVRNRSTISAVGGEVRFETRRGTGQTHNARADYELGSVTADRWIVSPFVDGVGVEDEGVFVVSGGGLGAATVTVGGLEATILSRAGNRVTFKPTAETPVGLQEAVVVTPSGTVQLGSVFVLKRETPSEEEEDETADPLPQPSSGPVQDRDEEDERLWEKPFPGGGLWFPAGAASCSVGQPTASTGWSGAFLLLLAIVGAVRFRALRSSFASC